MRILIVLSIIIFSVSMASITISPEIAMGKVVNGNRAIEIIPIRFGFSPVPEWMFNMAYSVNYTKARSGIGSWNHYSQGVELEVIYKPFKFIENFTNINTLSDFTISFTKSFSSKYAGSNNDVDYIPGNAFERIAVGFNMELE